MCLAPNKQKAFGEIYRVLKPGGTFAICTSAVKTELNPGVNWPVCMRMFAHIDELDIICKQIGFQNVDINMDNSLMMFELPEYENQDNLDSKGDENNIDGTIKKKNRVHVGSGDFKHLEN